MARNEPSEGRIPPVPAPDSVRGDTELYGNDEKLAFEIAEFVADRASDFADSECQRWAVTDFRVWSVLAGRSPRLALQHDPLPGDADENAL